METENHFGGPYDSCANLIQISIDNAIWMGGSPDWSTLRIHLGEDYEDAMAHSEKALNNWRLVLNDQWNVHGLVAGQGYYFDGMPWCTSHYGFHMVLWHLPFAVSGQQYSALSKSLSFNPKGMKSPYTVPLLIPNIYGFLAVSDGYYSLSISRATVPLVLESLSVDGVLYPYINGTLTLLTGDMVKWEA